MAKSAWPTTSELSEYLTGFGIASVPAGVSLQDELDAAVDAMRRYLGRTYLQASSASKDYNPPRTGTLDLGGVFTAITSVKVGKSNSSAGTALTDQVDYWPKPFGGPYTYIEFRDAQYGEPESIEVTGTPGESATIPVDLWKAVRDFAASSVYGVASIAGTVTPQASKIKQGPVDIEFRGSSSKVSTDQQLMNAALSVFKSYRRPQVIGLGQ